MSKLRKIITNLKGKKKYSNLDLITYASVGKYVAPYELNGPQLSKFLIDLDKLGIDNPSLNIYTAISERVHDVQFLPGTKTLVMTNDSFSTLIDNTLPIIKDVADKMHTKPSTAFKYITEFFEKHPILIKRNPLDKFVYDVVFYAEALGPSTMVLNLIVTSKNLGLTTLQVMQSQPLIIVALPSVAGLLFQGLGVVVGESTALGKTFNTLSSKCYIPQRYFAMLGRAYVAPIVYKISGVLPVFNWTNISVNSPQWTMEDVKKGLKALDVQEAVTTSVKKALTGDKKISGFKKKVLKMLLVMFGGDEAKPK